MRTRFDIKFWKRQFIKDFELNETGKELLNNLISANKQLAEKVIVDNYEGLFYRLDFIDRFSDNYDKDKINDLLQQLDYEPLTDEEIKEYNIKESEQEMEE